MRSVASRADVVRRALVFAAFVATTLVAAAPHARADADKAAEKQLRAAQAKAFATFKSSLGVDVKAFAADVAALETKVALSSDGPTASQSLFDALVTLQTNVTAQATTAATAQATAAKDLLAALAPATEGAYPAALYPGDGTPTAAFESAVDTLLAKTYAALRKRIATTVRRIERKGTHVNFRLAPPRRPARVWSSKIVDFTILPAPTIDVIVAFSTAAAAGDGKLRVAGQAAHVDSPAIPIDSDVSATAVFDGRSADQKVTPSNGRYAIDFANADFVEGVWLVLASQNLIPADASIGVR